MIALTFAGMVYFDSKYPDTPPLFPALFLVLAVIEMVAEGLQ